jgi:hypothetical protein
MATKAEQWEKKNAQGLIEVAFKGHLAPPARAFKVIAKMDKQDLATHKAFAKEMDAYGKQAKAISAKAKKRHATFWKYIYKKYKLNKKQSLRIDVATKTIKQELDK